MKFTVRILKRAASDAQHIHDWLAERNPNAAKRWLDAWLAALRQIENLPHSFPLCPESKTAGYDIRHAVFRVKYGWTYRALYTVVDSEVRILRIRGPGQSNVNPDDLV